LRHQYLPNFSGIFPAESLCANSLMRIFSNFPALNCVNSPANRPAFALQVAQTPEFTPLFRLLAETAQQNLKKFTL
jgi:hypothetical protein